MISSYHALSEYTMLRMLERSIFRWSRPADGIAVRVSGGQTSRYAADDRGQPLAVVRQKETCLFHTGRTCFTRGVCSVRESAVHPER